MQRVTGNSIRLGPTQILEAACTARDLARVEEAMLTVMRAGRSDPQDDELLSTAAKVVWDIVCDSGTVDERERARLTIRRAVQWRVEAGNHEGAYSLAHITGDRVTLEDVLVGAARDRKHNPSAARVMAVVQERLVECRTEG